jgi:hypothetical protein
MSIVEKNVEGQFFDSILKFVRKILATESNTYHYTYVSQLTCFSPTSMF